MLTAPTYSGRWPDAVAPNRFLAPASLLPERGVTLMPQSDPKIVATVWVDPELVELAFGS